MFSFQVPEIQRYVPELAPEDEHEGLPLETLDFKVDIQIVWQIFRLVDNRLTD